MWKPPKTETTFEPMGRGGRCGEGSREGASLRPQGCSVANIIRLTRKVTLALWEAYVSLDWFSSGNFESFLTDSCPRNCSIWGPDIAKAAGRVAL